jgi:DNA-binding transcriptional LysR family regulator
MDFHQLEYVMAIAKEKSFSKASKKLYISQPSLSQYIIRLEQQLGIKLFDRTTNPLILTFAGEKYIKTAKSILDLKKQLGRELNDISDSKKGRLTIGIPLSIERYLLPLVLPEFYKRFPGVEIKIEEYSSIQLEEMLLAGEIDIAILHLPIQNERIIYEPISAENIFLLAPPGQHNRSIIELGKQHKLDFSYLQDEKFILLKQGYRMRFVADEIFKRAQFKPNILLEIRNLDTAYRLCAAGVGFTLIPENVIGLLNTNQYQGYFLIDDITYTLALAYRHGEYLTKATHEFIIITKEIIGSKHKSRIFNNKKLYKISTYNPSL